MGRKHKHPEHENLERWLVSYADFITLLFATFTALYALSVSDLAKLKNVAAAISEGFHQQSLISGIQSVLQGKSPPSENSNPMSSERGAGKGVVGKHDSMTYSPGEKKAVEQTVKELRQSVSDINKGLQDSSLAKDGEGYKGVELSVQERGIRVSFDSSIFFGPGSAQLKHQALKVLDEVAERLKKMSDTNFFHVEGHTDNSPILTAIYPSNWELSSARASSVVRYLIDKHQYDPAHLAAVGYGSSRPYYSNQTLEGQIKNRRIDIIIYGKLSGRNVDSRSQFATEENLVKAEQPIKKPSDRDVIQVLDETKGPPSNPINVMENVEMPGKTPMNEHLKMGKFDPMKPSHAPEHH